jgi:hypothetical protein
MSMTGVANRAPEPPPEPFAFDTHVNVRAVDCRITILQSFSGPDSRPKTYPPPSMSEQLTELVNRYETRSQTGAAQKP